MSSSRFLRAFTILELLIVFAVFGLLATLAVLSLNSSRARMRDAQRVSDVSLVRTALSQFWLEKATYPESQGSNLGQAGQNADVLTGVGFVARENAAAPVYIERMPIGPKAGEYYRYHGGPNGYSLRFMTETETVYGLPGVYYAHASGVNTTDQEQ